MSVRSVGPRRGLTVKVKKPLDEAMQYIETLYEPKSTDATVEADIVLVPGLGADPMNCWKSERTSFNWVKDKEGLQKDFPRSRILLYRHLSAFRGTYRTKQFLDNLARTLLICLRISRQPEKTYLRRPIILIGHSMGGLIITKAITMANKERSSFSSMFESIAGCVFFGTPFNGTAAAVPAALFAAIGETFDYTSSSKLVEMMQPGDESVRMLKEEFLRDVNNMSQRIDLYCFWENEATNFAAIGGLPSALGAFIPRKYSEFVTRDSAVLQGYGELGLDSNHRDLIRFESAKDPRYAKVRDQIKPIINRGQLVVKNRLNATRNIDRQLVKSVLEVLEGAEIKKKRKTLSAKHAASSWIVKEAAYQEWRSSVDGPGAVRGPTQRPTSLWIRGQLGRGKTSNTIAILDDIDRLIRAAEEAGDEGKAPPLVAYFFCDSTSEFGSAEELLKSLLRQLVDQLEILAPYVKHFVKSKNKDEKTRSTPPLTVENMWQALQDMLWNGDIESRVYFVINNLHSIQDNSQMTRSLMKMLSLEISNNSNDNDSKRASVRWLFTSREDANIKSVLNSPSVQLIDLEDEKYVDQVQLELRKHAHTKVAYLKASKQYNRDTAYFAQSLIGKRAPNTQWIDIACMQLDELHQGDSGLKVRQVLDNMPKDLTLLLDRAWQQVFKANEDDIEQIKEMLRTLAISFEDPTEDELTVLTGLSSSDQQKIELRKLVEKCRPLLVIRPSDSKIGFMNVVVKSHLQHHGEGLIGLSEEEAKWQHGVLALRSFSHIMDRLDFPEPDENVVGTNGEGEMHVDHGVDGVNGVGKSVTDEPAHSDDGASEVNNAEDDEDEGDDEEDYAEDDDEDEVDEETERIKGIALECMVKYWLQHASKATFDIAEDLSDEEAFWKDGSMIRRRWLLDYARLNENEVDDWPVRNMSALQAACAFGFAQLVVCLLKNGHEKEIGLRDEWQNSALHIAANFNQAEIVDVLLKNNANIDDGVDTGDATPLGMAAMSGRLEIMRNLIARGADINVITELTTDGEKGPPINAAIMSGSVDAVKLLVESGARISVADTTDDSVVVPLAMATADMTIFDYLIDQCGDKLSPKEYSEALQDAAYWGRVEVFEKLLQHQHTQEGYQAALNSAADEENWNIVSTLLQKCQGLDCDKLFVSAANSTEDHDGMFEEIWTHTRGSVSAKVRADALYEATDCEKESTVQLLLEKYKADPNATGEEYGNALTATAYDGTLNIVRILVERGADINSPNGWALQAAASQGHVDVVEYLLQKGADVNARTTNDHFTPGTALQAACEAGNSSIVEMLLKHRANPDFGPDSNTCPLVAAAEGGEQTSVELLVKAGANVNVMGGAQNCTALNYAVMYLPLDSVKLLLDAGADMEMKDGAGDTALLTAALVDEQECLGYLLARGADITHVNNNGQTAIQAAVKFEFHECVRILADRVSLYLVAIKSAMDSGNAGVRYMVENIPPATFIPRMEETSSVQAEEEVGEHVPEAVTELPEIAEEPQAEIRAEREDVQSNTQYDRQHSLENGGGDPAMLASAIPTVFEPHAPHLGEASPPALPQRQQQYRDTSSRTYGYDENYESYSRNPETANSQASTAQNYLNNPMLQQASGSGIQSIPQRSSIAGSLNSEGRSGSPGLQGVRRKPAPGMSSVTSQDSSASSVSAYQATNNAASYQNSPNLSNDPPREQYQQHYQDPQVSYGYNTPQHPESSTGRLPSQQVQAQAQQSQYPTRYQSPSSRPSQPSTQYQSGYPSPPPSSSQYNAQAYSSQNNLSSNSSQANLQQQHASSQPQPQSSYQPYQSYTTQQQPPSSSSHQNQNQNTAYTQPYNSSSQSYQSPPDDYRIQRVDTNEQTSSSSFSSQGGGNSKPSRFSINSFNKASLQQFGRNAMSAMGRNDER